MREYKLTQTKMVEEVDAEITCWPDEVDFSLKGDLSLTPERAEELASMLITAAETARHLRWADPDSVDLDTIDDRDQPRLWV